jgi:ABC-type glycerol-3-phosphate transport system permease component
MKAWDSIVASGMTAFISCSLAAFAYSFFLQPKNDQSVIALFIVLLAIVMPGAMILYPLLFWFLHQRVMSAERHFTRLVHTMLKGTVVVGVLFFVSGVLMSGEPHFHDKLLEAGLLAMPFMIGWPLYCFMTIGDAPENEQPGSPGP